MEDTSRETDKACSSLGRLRFFPWRFAPLFIVFLEVLPEVMNFLHHRTGLDMVKIQPQLLSQNLFDRPLRGQGTTSGAKKAGERGPNLPLELQAMSWSMPKAIQPSMTKRSHASQVWCTAGRCWAWGCLRAAFLLVPSCSAPSRRVTCRSQRPQPPAAGGGRSRTRRAKIACGMPRHLSKRHSHRIGMTWSRP